MKEFYKYSGRYFNSFDKLKTYILTTDNKVIDVIPATAESPDGTMLKAVMIITPEGYENNAVVNLADNGNVVSMF